MSAQRTATPKVLIAYTGTRLGFAEQDRDILDRRYIAETFGFSRLRELPSLRRRINTADVVIFWFVGRAAMYAMLPPPRNTRIISLVGGYEAARVKDLGYGSGLSFWRRRFLKYILRKSHRIVAVSDFTRRELKENYGVAMTDITVIHNAIDTTLFIPQPGSLAKNAVFTVGSVSRGLIRKKGFDVLVGAAQRLPEVQFVVVGGLLDSPAAGFARRAPQNVEFVGELSQHEMQARFQSAAVYFQPSRHESFGVALIEAMSCGCVPVVSRCGALPEVVGDAGYYLDRLEPDHAAKVLQRALHAPSEARDRARARVVECFDIRRRAEKLYRLIDELLESRV